MAAGLAASGRSEGQSALPVFQLPVVAGNSGPSLTCRLIIPIFVFVFTWSSSPWVSLCLHDLLIRTPITEFKAHPNPVLLLWGFPGGSVGKESACNAGDLGSIPGSGGSPGEGNGYPH